MKTIVTDCYTEDDQRTFTDGISKLQEASKKKFDKSFMDLTAEQKTEFLVELDKAAKDRAKELSEKDSKMTDEEKHKRRLAQNDGSYKRDPQDDPHYFSMCC